MKYTTISDGELLEIKKMLQSMLSKSSHGIFYSMGKIIGASIAENLSNDINFFDEASDALIARNFVEEITFNGMTVSAKGSIELESSAEPTCDILRGIITALYKKHENQKLFCEEIQCQSKGNAYCVFELREGVI